MITDFGSARIQQSVDAVKDDGIAEGPAVDDAAEGLTSPKVKFTGTTLELTLTGPMYTLRWTAPEVLDEGMQGTRSDMWAVGWICWEIMTGKLPFEELMDPQFIFRITLGRLPAVRDDEQLSPILPLCSLITDCWILRPAQRIDASTFWRKVRFMGST